ncbi:coiled-coil domain-containing protein 33 [Salminus brasiliensis]|uniref:coiled-coil domain-containing protein 33 n=1 Tax=Salminus brasiliensis TaxID=930266 RepID=UPI003B82EBAF
MQTSKEPKVLPTTRQLQRDGYDLPAYYALAQILPEYQHLLKIPKAPQKSKGEPGEQKKSQTSSELNQTFEIQSPAKGLPVADVQCDDPHVAEINEHQTKELENYRTAMCKMAEDILALRSKVTSLEAENSQLRSELSLHQDLGWTLLDDTDIDVMTKTEITDRIISLKTKLASESSKAAEQRDKIQRLQNELIRKNDSEKELVLLKQAHQQQQAVLLRYQGRIRKFAGLEATVRQQEKIIERMEKLLDTKLRERNKENAERKKAVFKHKDDEESKRREIESVLAAENSRLREELERLRHQPPAVIIQQPAQIEQPFSDSEKLRLLGQLERAEAYIHTLEKQLEENARQWGREKQDMLLRLSEYDHGFTLTSTMIQHDLPPKNVSDSVLRLVQHRQLDPMK